MIRTPMLAVLKIYTFGLHSVYCMFYLGYYAYVCFVFI